MRYRNRRGAQPPTQRVMMGLEAGLLVRLVPFAGHDIALRHLIYGAVTSMSGTYRTILKAQFRVYEIDQGARFPTLVRLN
jgi:hypothetical protein